ncbi:MAG: amidohydrolase family protein, partial [Actinomycetota bacterium]|nr:amidohydrolase family protein [Actinomycetota bacterium]
MPYVENLTVHDADAHIMETPDWLDRYLDPGIGDRLPERRFVGGVGGTKGLAEQRFFERMQAQQADPTYRAQDDELLLIRKNWDAPGSFISADRPAVLDGLGFQSQLIFNTFDSSYINALEHSDDPALAYGVARAHNRAMLDFTSIDRRLLASCCVPLANFDSAAAMAVEAVKGGAAALLVPSNCPKGHSPSHVDLDRVWAIAQEAEVPVVFHVGGGGNLIN